MTSQESLEQTINKKFAKKDKRKARKMKVSGKNVFELKKTIAKKAASQD